MANTSGFEVGFHDALKEIYDNISDAFFQMLSEKNRPDLDEESLRNISQWKSTFESDTKSLKLELIRDGLVKLSSVSVSPSCTCDMLELNYLMTSPAYFCSILTVMI